MLALIIVQPVSAGLQLIGAARRHGLQPVVLSYQRDDRTVPADVLAGSDATLYQVDTNDRAAVLAMVKQIAGTQDVAGVLPGFEYFVPAAAEVAASLGLPGLDPAAAERVRDKLLMRQALAEAGLAIPQFRLATSPEAVVAAAAAIGYPVVIKPPRAAGSVHVTRVAGPAELQDAYHALCAETDLDLDNELGREVLVEEYLDGPEYSAEGYVAGGVATVVSITEKLLSPPPSFIELGHTVPADLPPAQLQELAGWAATVAEALGVDNALFHLEFRICRGAPFVVELGARMPGDQITALVELSTGISLADVFVELATGDRSSDRRGLNVEFGQIAGIRFFSDPGLTELSRVPTLEQLLGSAPQVRNAAVTAAVGHRPNIHRDFRSRLGWVVLAAPDRQVLDAAWADIGARQLFG